MARNTVPAGRGPGSRARSPVRLVTHVLFGGGEQIDQWAVASDPFGLKFATSNGFPARLKTAWISTEYRADDLPTCVRA